MILKTKKCSKCREIKTIDNFCKSKNSKDGYQYQCRECLKQYRENNKKRIKQYMEKWRKDNNEYKKQYMKQWHKNNKEYEKKWRKDNEEYMKEYRKQWELNNREYRNRYMIQYRNNNSQIKLSRYISGGIIRSLKNGKNGTHWEDLVNYTLQDLTSHLEKRFKTGMTWDNQGKWHLDHIRPISSFNFSSYKDEEFKQCWALCNLQPLWAKENQRKSNKTIEEI
jgi:hypothetical protein